MDKKKENKKRKYQILTLLFGAVFVCCIVWLIAYFAGLRRAEAEMEDIRDSYVAQGGGEESQSGEEASAGTQGEAAAGQSALDGDTDTPGYGEADSDADLQGSGGSGNADTSGNLDNASGYLVPDKTVDITSLQQEVNSDIYAWITVPGTVIDYPVLQHPEEMDYYLEYNLDGTKGYPGCIYTQRMNGKEWEDVNTVLYGHNMKNGTMFAGLHKFEDGSFFEENRYIYVYTEDGRVLVYEIFAAYVAGNEHLLMSYDLYTETGVRSYFDSIFSHTGSGCHFLEDVELTAEDKIITLSTCISGQAAKRYLVQGVLRAEEVQP